jgi:RNA-directed DNA polymerase
MRQRLFLLKKMEELLQAKLKAERDRIIVFRLPKSKTSKDSGDLVDLRVARSAAQFLNIKDAKGLCSYLQQNFLQIDEVLNNPKYHAFAIPKKQGGKRWLEVPMPNLMRMQRKLNQGLQSYYALIRPESSHGFVKKTSLNMCSIVTNAQPHIRKSYLLNIDLKDFFTSINASQVRNVFRSECFGFNENLATVLALIFTYRGHLPQGSPTSPVISNFICLMLDDYLEEWAKKRSASYTRYADDLTFSSEEPFEEKDFFELQQIMEKEGFTINKRKVRKKGKGRKMTVTGLIVNEKVNVDRKLIRNVRAMTHDIRLNGLQQASRRHFGSSIPDSPLSRDLFLNKLRGTINFIGQVRGKDDLVYLHLRSNFLECLVPKSKWEN